MAFKEDARKLLDAVGGPDNVSAVTHCATRMRFVLHDQSLADMEAIENIDAVKGSFTQAGQFQVIIGNSVSEFYKEFVALANLQEGTKESVKAAAVSNQSKIQQAMTFLAEIFAPIIPAIIVGGLILGFRNILEAVPFSFLNGQTIVEVSPFWAGVNAFLWLPGEAIFHFLPVGITWSVTRKMGTTQILGIVLGITLVSPQLLNAYGAAEALAAGDVPQWDFGFSQLDMIGY